MHGRLRDRREAMDIASGCALLDKDVSTTLELPWALRTQTVELWTSRTYTPPSPAELDEFDPADFLLIVDKNIKAIDAGSDIEIIRDAADAIATEIMDRLNRPWPEIPAGGAVLEISLLDGDLVWATAGQKICRLGDLGALAAG